MKVRKSKNGFTLIELLAVIVILGLLMAIAIPSITKYITQSRKKTITTTIGNYIGALTNQVNDMEYIFTETNTVYAVPIECISLERGGTNPFGEWYQANASYWAYVLVQYDDVTSSYTYGFTFKDSAGYGLYPTSIEKLKESGSQVQQNLDLTRPTNGTIANITDKSNWAGFLLEDDTNLVVLMASSDGETGDGISTCTLCQKGGNYDKVEEEKTAMINKPLYFGEPYSSIISGDTISYMFFEDGSVKFYENCELVEDLPPGVVEYSGNKIISDGEIVFEVSNDKKNLTMIDGSGMVFTLNQSANWCVNETTNLPMLMKKNDLSAFWAYKEKIKTITFQNSINVPDNISVDHKWDVSKAQNGKVMAYIIPNVSNSSYYDLYIQGEGKIYANPDSSYLFYNFKYVDSINGIEILDTSKVTNMSYMFSNTGQNATTFNIENLNNWDTSNVINMRYMFQQTGYNATKFNIGNLSSWDTSKVTNMLAMFYEAGYNAITFNIGNLGNWNTSNVTNMASIFYCSGYKSTTWNIGDLSGWDTSKVTNMWGLFNQAGVSATSWNVGNLSNWNVSNVTNMGWLFHYSGFKATIWNIGDLSGWDTSKVTNMEGVFSQAGFNATKFDIGNIGKWNTSNVTTFREMFNQAGVSAKSWNVGDLSKWNTSKSTSMFATFIFAGASAINFNVGDLSNWDTSNVTNMDSMFYCAGRRSTTFNIGNLSNWNTSNVTNMDEMFYDTGSNANWSLDCSNWNVDNVKTHVNFNYGVTTKVTSPVWK